MITAIRQCWAFAILAITAASLQGTARADGNQMLELCKRSNRDVVIAYVTGAMARADKDLDFVQGVLEQAIESGSNEVAGVKDIWKSSRKYCAPGGDVTYQAADIFCGYLLVNPQERKKAAIDLLDVSLQQSWPCPFGTNTLPSH